VLRPGEGLVPVADDIAPRRIEFDQETAAAMLLGRDQGLSMPLLPD